MTCQQCGHDEHEPGECNGDDDMDPSMYCPCSNWPLQARRMSDGLTAIAVAARRCGESMEHATRGIADSIAKLDDPR